MSRLILVRHGQARAFEEDSDRLTEHGMEQALKVGQYFASRRVAFDEVYSGTLERQKRTLLLVSNAYRDARLLRPQIPHDDDIVPQLVDRVCPVHNVVKVDLYIPGCPPPAKRIRAVLEALLAGKTPEMIGRDMLKFG
jgi:coenzyme F420-reducing hydrogenase gamma subunit